MKPIKKAAFIGLGVMGYPMAGHLAQRAGLDVAVYNRTAAKADQWAGEFGGKARPTPAAAAQEADLVCLCVGNDHDLRAVMLGQGGVLEGVNAGAIIADHTTVSAEIARELSAEAVRKGAVFLDAPVSGGQIGAEKGQLTVMVGGDAEAFAAVEPVMRQSYAREIRHMGPSGAGQLTKMVNQICIAGVLQGLAEGLAFGMKAGLDMDRALAVTTKGSAQSWQMENRGPTMVRDQFDFGFAVQWMIKDLGLALDEAKKNGAKLESTEQILSFYKELEGGGFGRLDTSSLIKRLSKSYE